MARVLLTGFCAVPGPRRAGVQMRHVIRALTPHHSVDLLVSREGDQPYVERQGSVRVLRVPTHEADLRSQIQSFQRALKRQLDGADYDVVHCRDSWSAIPVLELKARFDYAVVYDLSRSPLGETTGDAELDAQCARDEEACLLAADQILAPTPAAVKALQGRGAPERVVLSPPGVDVDRFDWDDAPKVGVPRILYVGSIDPGRGLRVLVRAMAAIVREVDAQLVIAGSYAPKFEGPLKESIRELGLADKIELLGPVDHDQLPALIATATVCVVPAAADLTPNPTVVYPTKLLEYMACKRPMVAPRRETVAQVVENNREVLLFEPGDPIDLARKVLRLLGEPQLRNRVAQNAYDRVRRDYTASAARRAIRAAYTALTERFAIAVDAAVDESPKIELLADDDFEATVFEEAPSPNDTAISNKLRPLENALTALDDDTGSAEIVVTTHVEPDETAERAPAAAGPRERDWTLGPLVAPPPPPLVPQADDWIVTNVAAAARRIDARSTVLGGVIDEESAAEASAHEDGTPIEGVLAAAPPLPVVDGSFVAGEIDVPTPPPGRDDRDTPAVELHVVGGRLGSVDDRDRDPDTGSRTPPLERR